MQDQRGPHTQTKLPSATAWWTTSTLPDDAQDTDNVSVLATGVGNVKYFSPPTISASLLRTYKRFATTTYRKFTS